MAIITVPVQFIWVRMGVLFPGVFVIGQNYGLDTSMVFKGHAYINVDVYLWIVSKIFRAVNGILTCMRLDSNRVLYSRNIKVTFS